MVKTHEKDLEEAQAIDAVSEQLEARPIPRPSPSHHILFGIEGHNHLHVAETGN